jgi:hypothetical protein
MERAMGCDLKAEKMIVCGKKFSSQRTSSPTTSTLRAIAGR